MTTDRRITCTACMKKVAARLTNGAEIYPHRPDLYNLPFWKCDSCGNFVGCHHKTNKPTEPLGCIPTPELRKARQRIHAILDPLWKSGRYKRGEIYKIISNFMGFDFHTSHLRNLTEAQQALDKIEQIAKEVSDESN